LFRPALGIDLTFRKQVLDCPGTTDTTCGDCRPSFY